ncbi:MAG: GntR family transcriptional regulator [Pseudomonadota bacterium]
MKLVDKIEAKLLDQMMSGELAPGDRLNETALAEKFKASRTPVREAINRLVTSGHVTLDKGVGARVAVLDAASVISMFEALSELEALCARLAARRISAAELRDLEDVHESYRSAAEREDIRLYYDLSIVFHDRIVALSQNKTLTSITQDLAKRLQPYRRKTLQKQFRIKQSWAEHEAILEAFRRGDAEAAERQMRAHTSIVADNAMAIIQLLDTQDAADARIAS